MTFRVIVNIAHLFKFYAANIFIYSLLCFKKNTYSLVMKKNKKYQ